MNVSEAELAPVLKANFMQPVIQITNNILVVDTGRERILVDSGFGEKLGPSFGSFPGLEVNLRRAGIAPESIDLVVTSHGHLDHIGGFGTRVVHKIGGRWRTVAVQNTDVRAGRRH
jgi:glyoxylase-like metal-dependent hydrolase (beta-lactamase superfamily II)